MGDQALEPQNYQGPTVLQAGYFEDFHHPCSGRNFQELAASRSQQPLPASHSLGGARWVEAPRAEWGGPPRDRTACGVEASRSPAACDYITPRPGARVGGERFQRGRRAQPQVASNSCSPEGGLAGQSPPPAPPSPPPQPQSLLRWASRAVSSGGILLGCYLCTCPYLHAKSIASLGLFRSTGCGQNLI